MREVLERGLRFQQYLHYFLLILAGFYGNLFFFTILLKLQYKFNFYNFFVTLVSILFFISSIFFIQLIFQILLKCFKIKFSHHNYFLKNKTNNQINLTLIQDIFYTIPPSPKYNTQYLYWYHHIMHSLFIYLQVAVNTGYTKLQIPLTHR